MPSPLVRCVRVKQRFAPTILLRVRTHPRYTNNIHCKLIRNVHVYGWGSFMILLSYMLFFSLLIFVRLFFSIGALARGLSPLGFPWRQRSGDEAQPAADLVAVETPAVYFRLAPSWKRFTTTVWFSFQITPDIRHTMPAVIPRMEEEKEEDKYPRWGKKVEVFVLKFRGCWSMPGARSFSTTSTLDWVLSHGRIFTTYGRRQLFISGQKAIVYRTKYASTTFNKPTRSRP